MNRLPRWLLPAVLVLLVLTVLVGSVIGLARPLSQPCQPALSANKAFGYVVDAGGQRFHGGRVDRGEHADTQLVAAQLPVRLRAHDSVPPQGGRYVVRGQRGSTHTLTRPP